MLLTLSYLTKLPVNALKIDRSFIVTMVESPSSLAIVTSIISLAHSLRLEVIAEGVELEEQAKLLRLLRCEQIQGHLLIMRCRLSRLRGCWGRADGGIAGVPTGQ